MVLGSLPGAVELQPIGEQQQTGLRSGDGVVPVGDGVHRQRWPAVPQPIEHRFHYFAAAAAHLCEECRPPTADNEPPDSVPKSLKLRNQKYERDENPRQSPNNRLKARSAICTDREGAAKALDIYFLPRRTFSGSARNAQ